LARHIAERLGRKLPQPRVVAEGEIAPLLARDLRACGDLWGQKAYLARVVELGPRPHARDRGIQPLSHFVDESGPDAVAVTIETDHQGVTFPCVYRRRAGTIRLEQLDPHPLNEFDGEPYRRALETLVR
jgi:hypothetical protein